MRMKFIACLWAGKKTFSVHFILYKALFATLSPSATCKVTRKLVLSYPEGYFDLPINSDTREISLYRYFIP